MEEDEKIVANQIILYHILHGKLIRRIYSPIIRLCLTYSHCLEQKFVFLQTHCGLNK